MNDTNSSVTGHTLYDCQPMDNVARAAATTRRRSSPAGTRKKLISSLRHPECTGDNQQKPLKPMAVNGTEGLYSENLVMMRKSTRVTVGKTTRKMRATKKWLLGLRAHHGTEGAGGAIVNVSSVLYNRPDSLLGMRVGHHCRAAL